MKITPEQIDQLREYVDKWMKLVVSTEPTDMQQVREGVRLVYKAKKLPQPRRIVRLRSPLALLRALHRTKETSFVESSYVAYTLSGEVTQPLRALNTNIFSLIRRMLRAHHDSVHKLRGDAYATMCCNDFIRNCLNRRRETWSAAGQILLSQHSGHRILLKNTALIADRPIRLTLRNNVLHNDTGPAVAYSDGFSVYALNGVLVPQEIVTTPASKIPAELVLRTRNAEVRREIVKKIGVERLIEELNFKLLHEHNGYQLLRLRLSDAMLVSYLKMVNPSTGSIHIEGVPGWCASVQDALDFRRYGHPRHSSQRWNPQIIT